ncbi:pilus assembly protein CpaB [Hasllibacter halocynthiae]|uniref:Pilus assembly protein CpaB n=1 Tax=Hasllibacter halocynthiae TaxID=595589 RepID=A0A2T0X9J6_9RHOB|nr:Flp pilus assembly protein CpaB [Hasllibacter halocynthiae]PRY95620.1 pilus assembly protein CpaB [Hasllibacter halocynthiae]
MRLIFGLVLLAGLGLAGFAVYLAKGTFGQSAAEASALRDEVVALRGRMSTMAPVFVAGRDLAYGDRLTEDDVRVILWPEEEIPGDAFRIVDGENDLFAGEDRRTVLFAMVEGEPMLPAKLTAPGEDAGLVARLTPGHRAFAIPVDAASGVSGFLRPGDRVDVYWSGSVNGETESGASGDVTRLIESNVLIVAVDQDDGADRTSARLARTVTVEALPRTVAALTQAQATGRLTLSLVGIYDDTVAERIEIDQQELLDIREVREVARPARAQVCTIRTRRGGSTVEVPVACPE